MRAHRAIIIAALSLNACDERAVNQLDLRGLEFEFGFLVLAGDGGGLTQVSPFFGVEGGEVKGTLPVYALREDETRAVLIALDRESLRAALPSFDAERAEGLVAVLRAPPESPVIVEGEALAVRGMVTTALPAGAKLYSVTSEDHDNILAISEADIVLQQNVRTQVSLEVPVDHEYCRIETMTPLRSIAGAPDSFAMLPTDFAGYSFRDTKRFGDGRLAMVSWSGIFLAREDEPWVWSEDSYLQLQLPNLPPRALAIDPRPYPDGRTRIVVTSGHIIGDQPKDRFGGYWIVSAGERDLRLEDTVIIPEHAFGEVAIGRDGRIIFGMQKEPIVYDLVPGEAARWHTLASRSGDEDDTTQVTATEDDEYPFVVATDGRLQLWKTSTGGWVTRDYDQPGLLIVELPRPMDLIAEGSGDSFGVWVGVQYGQIFHFDQNSTFQRYDVPLPPRGYPCSKSGMPVPLGGLPGIATLAVTPTHVFTMLQGCNPLFIIERNFRCAQVVSRNDEEIESNQPDFHSLEIVGSSVVAGGDSGLLMRSTW